MVDCLVLCVNSVVMITWICVLGSRRYLLAFLFGSSSWLLLVHCIFLGFVFVVLGLICCLLCLCGCTCLLFRLKFGLLRVVCLCCLVWFRFA